MLKDNLHRSGYEILEAVSYSGEALNIIKDRRPDLGLEIEIASGPELYQ